MTKPKLSVAQSTSVADRPLSEMTPAEICAKFPHGPRKPIEEYTTEELMKVKGMGPSIVGGAVYLAAQQLAAASAGGIWGPAILSKGFTEVPFVSHVNGSQGDMVRAPKEAA